MVYIRLTQEQFIEESKKIHGNKYDYSKVKYIKKEQKVVIVCFEHGCFEQTPKSHLGGSGCPVCAGKKISSKDNWVSRAKKVHGDKYDYSKVIYKNSQDKLEIICPIHGSFLQSSNHHLNGAGCPKCSGNYQPTTREIIDRFKEIHGDKYDYSKVEYKGNTHKLTIICPEHGEFRQPPNNHLKGWGCSKCSGKHKPTTEEFIEKAKNIHGETYSYNKVEYKNSKENVIITCPIHGDFNQTPNNHLSGDGCSKCNKSFGENKIEEILLENNINFETQKSFSTCKNKRPLKFDFYLPDYKLLVEYDGEQHYKPIEFYGGEKAFKDRKKRDNIKTKWALSNGYKLLRIKFDNNKIENTIMENIRGAKSDQN